MNSPSELVELIQLVQKAAVLQKQSPVIPPETLVYMITNPDEMQKLKFRLQETFGSKKRRYYFFLAFALRAVIFFFVSVLITSSITYLFDTHINGRGEISYYQSMFRTVALIALIPALLSSLMPHIHYMVVDIVSRNLISYFIIFRISKMVKWGVTISFLLLTISFLGEFRSVLKMANYTITGLLVVVAAHFAWRRAIKREHSKRSIIINWEADANELSDEMLKREFITAALYHAGVFLVYLTFTLFVLFDVKPKVGTDLLHSPLFKFETYREALWGSFFWLFILGFILKIVAFFRSLSSAKQK